MPGGFGNKIRYMYYKNKFKNCGTNVIIDLGVQIDGPEWISIGSNVHIDKYCIIATGKKLIGNIRRKSNSSFRGEAGEIIIGDNIHIAHFCIIMGYGGVVIESNCAISAGSKIYSLTNTPYDMNDKTKITSIMPHTQAIFLLAPVVLNSNVWLGLNSIVMPGTIIDKNSFCVSNSVLMGSFPENSYIAGQPAKKIRDRFEQVRVD
jgi:acetyltransferase-like isoleucine patch superfamily enzyme